MALTRNPVTTARAVARRASEVTRRTIKAAVTRKTVALALTFAGGAAATAGIALIYVPAGLIAAGAALAAFGLLVVDVDPPKATR